ncbi:hypothetical protein NEOLEDRAFT_137267 [Neolentinus lepideus HHB14362 ss-1]|uniref:Uncharacterized protein n=1 Tax=Neolentinus lepideus HHB14362 ss-1 TaxID=1314782 RepID=A0A165TYQ5_9AGAM|nr:hypothetical protein NEOLEDRAFT_137267 [Neolentinus lepideus HHB14362 ss-1]
MAICFFPAPGEHSAIRDQGQSVYHGKSVHALRGDDEHEHEYDAFAFLGKTRAKTTAEFDPRADQATHIPFAALTRTPSTSSPQSLTHTHSFPRCKPKMPKKRPSLQSIFIPSFLSPTAAHDASLPPTPISAPLPARVPALSEAPRPAHSRQQSSSSLASSYADSIHHNFSLTPAFDISPNPGPSPPSQDLLPDDPFANLSLSPAAIAFPSILTSPALPPPPPSTPKSPLSPAALDTSPLSRPRPLRTSASTSTLPIKARPAHTRPAFSTRPSLPSLRVLARTSVVMKKKVSAHYFRGGASESDAYALR